LNCTIFKFGGSLLEQPGLSRLMQLLISQRPDTLPVFVVGGGRAANLVRQWDRIHGLQASRAHWLAIDAMALNERLLVSACPLATLVDDGRAARAAAHEGRIPVLRTRRFLEHSSARVVAELPDSWEVTSDSIAATIAVAWEAAELVLVKSADLAAGLSSHAAARAGLVDAYFPRLTDGVAGVGWANGRTGGLIERWLPLSTGATSPAPA
jgi:aspartokinase-like uncharacterized kinase